MYLLCQGEDGEAGNPGQPGDTGVAVSHVITSFLPPSFLCLTSPSACLLNVIPCGSRALKAMSGRRETPAFLEQPDPQDQEGHQATTEPRATSWVSLNHWLFPLNVSQCWWYLLLSVVIKMLWSLFLITSGPQWFSWRPRASWRIWHKCKYILITVFVWLTNSGLIYSTFSYL